VGEELSIPSRGYLAEFADGGLCDSPGRGESLRLSRKEVAPLEREEPFLCLGDNAKARDGRLPRTLLGENIAIFV
jgi:hypothetical protein